MRLFIIEAPGKVRAFDQILKQIGYEGRVQATKGHLFEMPAELSDVGIDRTFREFERKPRDLALFERIRNEARLADSVFIATDADAEGDVIAWDVADIIRDMHPSPTRVKLTGMDNDSVRAAIEAGKPLNKKDAVAGRTRAIVDRLIGAGYSSKTVAVGRVSTALLGLAAKEKPSVYHAKLVAPSKDGGRPWMAEFEVKAPLDRAVTERLVKLEFPAIDASHEVAAKMFPPSHMGDILVRAGDVLDISPKEASDSLQRAYEAGRMSYPRSSARAFSADSIKKISDAIKKAGFKIDPEKFPAKGTEDVHDAPHPIGKVEFGSDPNKLAREDAVRTLVARDLVKSGQTHRREKAIVAQIAAFLLTRKFTPETVDAVGALDWYRDTGPRFPGQESWPESEIVERRADTVLLERAIEKKLGRPSTWGNHIETFMSRKLVTDELELTQKGRDWVAASPAELLDFRVSAAIEHACENFPPSFMNSAEREPWELNAERIANALPPRIKERLLSLIRDEPGHKKVDPIAEYGLDRDFSEEIAAKALPTYDMTIDE